MKKLIIASCLFLFTGCQSTFEVERLEMEGKISYFKDTRTGLCFACMSSYSDGANMIISIACVPCDSVQNLLLDIPTED